MSWIYCLVGLRLVVLTKTAVSRPAILATCTVRVISGLQPVFRPPWLSDACRSHTSASIHDDFHVTSTHRLPRSPAPYDDTCRPRHRSNSTRGFAPCADPVVEERVLQARSIFRERDGSGGRDFLRLPTELHQEICCIGRNSLGRPTGTPES
jgi:hypothetical protein